MIIMEYGVSMYLTSHLIKFLHGDIKINAYESNQTNYFRFSLMIPMKIHVEVGSSHF